MTIPRGIHPTGPDPADLAIPRPSVPWECADALGVSGTEHIARHLSTRERAAGYAELGRLAEVGSVACPRRVRRGYGRSILGAIGIVALVLGGAAVLYGVHGAEIGAMPDRSISPGAVATTDRNEICSWVGGLSYSKRHRQTSQEMKDAVLRAYGVPRPFHGEIDHIVPLCVGGADALTNLWPMLDYKAKDVLEAHVCREVCHGRMSASEGQAIFLGDWTPYLGRIAKTAASRIRSVSG